MSSARARRAASRRARVDDSISPVPPSSHDDDQGQQDNNEPQPEDSVHSRRSTRKRRAATPPSPTPPTPLKRAPRKGKRSKTSGPRDDQRISAPDDEVAKSPGEGPETNSQARDYSTQLGSSSAHPTAEPENDNESHEAEAARHTQLSIPVGGEENKQTDKFDAKDESNNEAPVRFMPASTKKEKSDGKDSLGTVEEKVNCGDAAPRAQLSAVPVTAGGLVQTSESLEDSTDEMAIAGLSRTNDSVAVSSLKESKSSNSVLTSVTAPNDISDNSIKKAPTAFLQQSTQHTTTTADSHQSTVAPSFLTSTAVESAAGLAKLLASSSSPPSDSEAKSTSIGMPHVLNIHKLENAAVDLGEKHTSNARAGRLGTFPGQSGPTSLRPFEAEADSRARPAPLPRDAQCSIPVDTKLVTESRKRPPPSDTSSTEPRGKSNAVAKLAKRARLRSGGATEAFISYDQLESATSGVGLVSHLDSLTIQQIRVRLFQACLSCHKGKGASRMFANYWDTISKYVCHDIAAGISSLADASVVLDSFLVTKQMRKLHNMLILALLGRCKNLQSSDPRIQDSVPRPWRHRLRVFSDKVPSALSTSDASTTAQPFQSIVPPAKLMLQSDFGLSSDVWVAGGLCGHASFDRQHDKMSGHGLQMPSIACRTPSSLPGALIVDPTVRKIIEEYDGLKVSENAIWLLIVAVRQYVRTVLEKTVRQTEFIREKTLPQVSLSSAALLAGIGKMAPGFGRGAPQDTTTTITSMKPTSQEKYVISPLDIALHLSSASTAFGAPISGSASRLAYERSVQSSFSPAFPASPAAVRPLHNFLVKTMQEKIKTIDTIARQDFRAGLQDTSWSPHPVPSPSPVNGGQQHRTLSAGLGRGAKDLAALKARAEISAKEAAVDPARTFGGSQVGSGPPGGATPLTSRSSTPVTTNTISTKESVRHVQSQGGDMNLSSEKGKTPSMRPPTTVAQRGHIHSMDSSLGQAGPAQLAGVPTGAFRQQGSVPLYNVPLAGLGREVNSSTPIQHTVLPSGLDIAPAPPANVGSPQLPNEQAKASQPSTSGSEAAVQNGTAPHQSSPGISDDASAQASLGDEKTNGPRPTLPAQANGTSS